MRELHTQETVKNRNQSPVKKTAPYESPFKAAPPILSRLEFHRRYGGTYYNFDFEIGCRTSVGDMAERIKVQENFDKYCEKNIKLRNSTKINKGV